MNLIVWDGNITADATLKFAPSGSAVLGFTVAGKVGFGDKAKTEYRRCVMFGKRGEKLVDHLIKGTGVIVTGEPNLESYQKDGVDKYYINIVVDKIQFVPKPSIKQENNKPRQNNSQATQSVPFNDEVPF